MGSTTSETQGPGSPASAPVVMCGVCKGGMVKDGDVMKCGVCGARKCIGCGGMVRPTIRPRPKGLPICPTNGKCL